MGDILWLILETIIESILEGLGIVRMIGIDGLISALGRIRIVIICIIWAQKIQVLAKRARNCKGGDRRLNQSTRKLADQPKPLVCSTVDQTIGIKWVKSLRSIFVNGCLITIG